MADTKFLDYAGLAYFKEKLDAEYETKIGDAIDVALPEADGITIVDNDGVWSAKLPENGAITSDANGLKLDLTKIAGNTLEVADNKLEVVIDGTTIIAGTADENTGKTELKVSLDNIADGTTIINDNGVLKVDVDALDIPTEYELPAATATVRGGVTVGDGLEITAETTDKLKVKAANDTITVSAAGIKVTDGKFAPLTEGKIPDTYLPAYVDEVVEGYYNEDDGKFYKDAAFTQELDLSEDEDQSKIYIDLGSNDTYRYGGTTYVKITSASIDIITNSMIDDLFPATSPSSGD